MDASTAAITDQATLHTEQLWTYREYSGVKYAAYLDPQGGEADFANGQLAIDSGSGWQVITNVTPYPVHVMDLLVNADGLWLFGTASQPLGGGATIWLSPDLGTTWTTSLALRPDASGNQRFYAATLLGAVLYAVLNDETDISHSYRLVGGVWSDVETLSYPVSDLVPFTINGVNFAVVIQSGKQGGTFGSYPIAVLTAPEDAASRPALRLSLPGSARDAKVFGGNLYVLDQNYVLWRIAADGTKTLLFTSTVPVLSFAITGTEIGFGTADSKVYKTALPA